jgi:hypothetical protein
VQNFQGSWRNGVAFLALVNSARPGLVDMDAVDADNLEENLNQAFELLEQHLGVPRLLEANDAMVAKPDKKSVMVYVATIKKAIERDEAVQEQAKKDANAGHAAKGEELFNQGNAKYGQASADDESHLDDVVAEAKTNLSDSDGSPDAFDKIVSDAKEDLRSATIRHEEAVDKFKEAKEEFKLVDDESCDQRILDCDDKVVVVEKRRRFLDQELQDRLNEAIKNERGKRKLKEGNEQLDTAIDEAGTELEKVLDEACEKIAASKTEQERINACNDARDKVKSKTKRFDEVKNIFDEAELLLVDEPEKSEAGEKAASCPELAQQLLDTLDSRLAAACNERANAELSDQDLLAIYHAFSLEVESLIDGEEATDRGIDHEVGAARTRLNQLMEGLRDMKQKESTLRSKLHAAVDAQLDAEGLP